MTASSLSYEIEKWMYGVAIVLGVLACIYTVLRFRRNYRRKISMAARLLSYKISLTVADLIILFIYAPTQLFWIDSYWWYGGDTFCRIFKFVSTFAFHLTGNMQVLIAVDRLYVTSRMNRMNAQPRYNTNMMVALAWFLALICAMPQFVIFRRGFSEEREPQCISVWTESRFTFQEQKDYIWYYEHIMSLIQKNSSLVLFANGTLKIAPLPNPEKTLEELEYHNHIMLVLEQVYNVFHLASICVLPYLIELSCYGCILYMLRGASHGHMMGFRDLCPNWRMLVPCAPKKRRRQRRAQSEPVTVPHPSPHPHECEEFLDMERQWSALVEEEASLDRPRAHSAGNRSDMEKQKVLWDPVSTIVYEDDFSLHRHSVADPLHPINVVTDISPEKHSDGQRGWRQSLDYVAAPIRTSKSFLRLICCKKVRSKKGLKEDTAPWQNTIAEARRTTRRKAFWMLTFNLLFWGPYCGLGIINSVTIFESFAKYQFVCALVVYNAITNILL